MKGYFTQSAVVLVDRIPGLHELERCLAGLTIAKRTEADGTGSWMGGNPGLLVAFRPEVNGYVVVDIVGKPWPDTMGDPKTEQELFGAWSMGWFGPFIYPGTLQRAITQAHDWPDAVRVLGQHHAFVRIKSSYALGAPPGASIMPPDYDALAELRFVTDVARRVLQMPSAVCYFNPNGESVHTAATLDELLSYHASQNLLPLAVWSNARLFNIEDTEGWSMVDTIGMEQLDVIDHEACFPRGRFDVGEVVNFLRNATSYVHQNGPVIEDGDTMNGPGGINWQGESFEESVAPAPRPVLRWLPCDGSKPPARLR